MFLIASHKIYSVNSDENEIVTREFVVNKILAFFFFFFQN